VTEFQGAGYWYGDMSNLDAANGLPEGKFYDMSTNDTAIVGPTLDPNTDNDLTFHRPYGLGSVLPQSGNLEPATLFFDSARTRRDSLLLVNSSTNFRAGSLQ
jgi:hypothetical protein